MALGTTLAAAHAKHRSAGQHGANEGGHLRHDSAGAMLRKAVASAIDEATRTFADVLHRGKAEPEIALDIPDEQEATLPSRKKSLAPSASH